MANLSQHSHKKPNSPFSFYGVKKMSGGFTATQQPPPESFAGDSAHGSIGPVIGVLALVVLLCLVAVVIGRLCFGRTVLGFGDSYNLESWVESKCSSCVDGRIGFSSPPITNSGAGDGEEGSSTAEQQSEQSPDGNEGS